MKPGAVTRGGDMIERPLCHAPIGVELPCRLQNCRAATVDRPIGTLGIPAIEVDAPLTNLSLDSAGALRPPPADEPGLVGWYGGGTTPGSVGTAITAGHVDLRTGRPGVFYGLGALAKGNTIEIDREDRRTAVFTVDAVEVYAKDSFPSEKVYGDSERAELRVITCGGGYAEHTGYRGNVVVYATLTAVE